MSNTNMQQNDTPKVILTSLGAWVLAAATLLSTTDASRALRQPALIGFVRPAYAAVDDSSTWNRNDNENETVHMPTKFDIGQQTFAVGGRK